MKTAEALIAGREVGAHARQQAATRLAQVVVQVQSLMRMPPGSEQTIEGIHQLRVSTRRFRAVLDTFEDLFPARERKKIRRSIKKVFAAAGEVRNRDITMELMDDDDPATPAMRSQLTDERRDHERTVRRMLADWADRDFSARWREALRLP